MPQDGSRVVGEDSEVPSMSEGERGRSVMGQETERTDTVCEVWRALTLKMALTFLWGNHCRVYWCPLSHNALPRGCLSAPRSSSTLAAGTQRKQQGSGVASQQSLVSGLRENKAAPSASVFCFIHRMYGVRVALTSTSAAPGSLLKHMAMVFRAILKKFVKDTDFPCNTQRRHTRLSSPLSS